MSVFISVTETFTQGSSGIPEFINFNPPLVAHEGQLYNYAVQAISNNLNTVTYSVPVGPAGLSIHSTTGLISWTPTFSQGRVTPYQVTVQASNGAHTASRTYFIAVLESTATQPPTVIVTPPTVIVSPPVTVTPPAAPLPLTIDDIEIHTERNGDVIVTWETNREALGRVIYGETSQTDRTENYTYDEATPDAGPAIRHEANLGDLDENTTYYLRAVAKTNDRMTVSPEIAFVKSARGLGLASATFAGLSLFSWFLILAIIALAILLFMAYRKRQMTDPK
jgi:hypothetical protein